MPKLNILNESTEIISQEERDIIHRDGLLHQEINIHFYTPQAELIYQHRAKDKDMWPDKLDATVGGHVEIGQSYEEAAIAEAKEETGLNIDPNKLELVDVVRYNVKEEATGNVNNIFQAIYLYEYNGEVSDLTIEEGKASGFEVWKIDDILNIEDKDKFIPTMLSPERIEAFKRIKEKLDNK